MNKIITVDGPSGAGKSTIAKLLANRINFAYLDTGSIYRAITYYMLEYKILAKQIDKIQEELKNINLQIKDKKVYLNAKDITSAIRTDKINEYVPAYAQIEEVRQFTRDIQKRIGEKSDCIIDGRDIGTVVFANAFCKFYLDANRKIRAERRLKEMNSTHSDKTIEQMEDELKKRDIQDKIRNISPLKIPHDALLIDTTNHSVEKVMEIMIEHYNKQLQLNNYEQFPEDKSQEFMEAVNQIEKIPNIEEGKFKKAKVISIGEEILLDIDAKQDATFSKEEFAKLNLTDIKVGDVINVYVRKNSSVSSRIIVSKLDVQEKETIFKLQKAYEGDTTVSGTVKQAVKGGFIIEVEGGEFFCPYSEFDLYKINQQKQIGLQSEFKVIEFNKQKIILSRKRVIAKEYEKTRKNFYDKTKPGDLIEGKIVKLMPYGALVEVSNGITAILKTKNFSWDRSILPEEIVEIGDTVKTQVLSLDAKDNKIEVSKKHTELDPMIAFATQQKVGDIVEGTVQKIEAYGAFIKVATGVEGLLHISDFSWTTRIDDPQDYLTPNSKLNVKILLIEPVSRKLSLGIKQLSEDPWANIQSYFAIDSHIKATIKKATQHVVYCSIKQGSIEGDKEQKPIEFEASLSRSDVNWKNEPINLQTMFPEEQIIETKIIGFNTKSKKIILGLKQLSDNPWIALKENYANGKKNIEGTISKIIDKGIIVQINEHIEGFCHSSYLNLKAGDNIENVFKVGDKQTFFIQNIDEDNQKIILSLKAHLIHEEKKDIQRYMKDNNKTNKVTIGDLIK